MTQRTKIIIGAVVAAVLCLIIGVAVLIFLNDSSSSTVSSSSSADPSEPVWEGELIYLPDIDAYYTATPPADWNSGSSAQTDENELLDDLELEPLDEDIEILEEDTAEIEALPEEASTPDPVVEEIATEAPAVEDVEPDVAEQRVLPTLEAAALTPQPDAEVVQADWWETYFTVPVSQGGAQEIEETPLATLIKMINSAEKSIHIAAFEFNLDVIAEALIEAHNRGVEVVWITDNEYGLEEDEDDGHGQFHMMQEAGIEVLSDSRSGLMHNKFIIFDNETVWTGSMNITVNGTFRNNNNVLILHIPDMAAKYEREFQEMREGQFGPRSPYTLPEQIVQVGDAAIAVLFSPEDDVTLNLVDVLDNAQSSIRFMAFSFTDDDLGDLLLFKHQEGLDVKGIFEKRASETRFSELTKLHCNGLAVRQDGNPGVLHHKVWIVDDLLVLTGSFNFSGNANKSNDENVLLITDFGIAANYLEEFDRMWDIAAEVPEGDLDCEAFLAGE